MDKEYVQQIYDKLHIIPEPGYQEYKTSKLISDELEKIGYMVYRDVGGSTGIIAVLDSKQKGHVLGIRADMDALTYEIDGNIEYRHTCGHDAHSSMVLAAAKEIYSIGIRKGKIYFIFQPAEELLSGAETMINSGLLNDMTEVIGIHLRPIQEAKYGQAAAALWHSAAAPVKIKLVGVGAHGARPHLGVNAVEAAVLITNAINAIKANPGISHSIKVTKINTGTGANNAIPDEAHMYVDVRCIENKEMETILEKLRTAIELSAKANGTKVKYTIELCPAAEYAEELIDTNSDAIKEVMGEEGLIRNLYTAGSEDFHFYAKRLGCKAGYIGLGSDLTPGLHHKDMSFNRDALYHGTDILIKVIEKRLI